MQSPKLSLKDLLGEEYIDGVCEARSFVEECSKDKLISIAEEKVDFYPDAFRNQVDNLVDSIGKKICEGIKSSSAGASTNSFKKAFTINLAPLTGFGLIRIGEDGRAYLISKSEHYHASLGHCFPGYKLIQNAKKLGISNVTHNNTRGFIIRLLEQELIRTANGIAKQNKDNLSRIINSKQSNVINRVINIETGSLSVEAALKMMFARFYRLGSSSEKPVYSGKIQAGIDISAHTYKDECPPSTLTKLPLTSTYRIVDFIISKMYDGWKKDKKAL